MGPASSSRELEDVTRPESESVAEREIREAMERGEFDDLEGAGRPIPGLDGNYDPAWWARTWVRRARAQDAAWGLRRRIREQRFARFDSDLDRQQQVEALNAEIEVVNADLPRNEQIPVLHIEDLQ
ncbi:MAG: DUF1992 domain-containing protein [Gammaproteobacteria bacterium]|nr:DUF1992 domain-containing protein [Gammaproteobacteria bacterium]